ncbi:unnamed protein product [Rhizophagus irregularis]|nr:unnamed protein product [Rhizophagus irregularis]
MSEEVSYILGFYDVGNKLSTIFIRCCYDDLSGIIYAGKNLRHWRISGNPGIGNLPRLLPTLSARRKKRNCHIPPTRQICDSLSEKQVISGSVHEFRDYLGRDDVWYIVDAWKPKEYRGKTILIFTPGELLWSWSKDNVHAGMVSLGDQIMQE